MAKSTSQVADILRVEGIMAQGYGLNPKIVMRDKRLTTTAKAIYAYISSFAGAGNQAFPNRDLMIEELQINKNTYYKHMKILTDTDYIRIERTKGANGVFDKNIYIIVALPNPANNDKNVGSELNINADDKNSMSEEESKRPRIKRLKVNEKASVKELRKRLEIDNLKLSDASNADVIEEVFMAVEDMNSSEQISIGGNIKKKEAIDNLIYGLTADHIRLVVQIMLKNKKQLTNRKAYIQTCLVNSIFDVAHKNAKAKSFVEEKNEDILEREKIEKDKADKQQQIENYKKYPKLKVIDEKITEVVKKISIAVIKKDKALVEKLEEEKEKLIEEREKIKL
ncbi:MAG: helix-turn-helix domain-containing protein [Aminipila sp.]